MECERFFVENKTPDINPSTLWESAKAYIRGAIIFYTSAQKKESTKRQLELEEAGHYLEAQFKLSSNTYLAKQLEAARSALNQLLTQNAESQIFVAKHRLFETCNKPGRLLACLARGKTECSLIPSLLDTHGIRHFKSTVFNKIIRSFYADLYSSDCTSSVEVRMKFLDKIKCPSLSDEQKAALCRPISKDEVSETISNLQGGKAPGPDGFGPDFYKTFCKVVVVPLTDMYVDCFDNGCLFPNVEPCPHICYS